METFYSVFFIFCLTVGGGLFIKWLAETRFGTKSLESVPPRPNFMPYNFPLVVMLGWLMLTSLGSAAVENLTSQMADWRQKLIVFSCFFVIEAAAVIFIVYSAKKYFIDGLYGFGIRLKTIFRDFGFAVAVFISVWPFVMLALSAVVVLGKYFVGPDFNLEKNEGLVVLLEYKQLSLRILMIIFAAVLTPIFEEFVFRGLIQTYFRQTLGYGPWQSILLTSAIFSLLHPLMHLPAIFILSAAMGYAYEKSGSILRSIFVHLLFNGTTIAFALTSNV